MEAEVARIEAEAAGRREELLANMTVYERAVHEFYENEARQKASAAKERANPLYGFTRETPPLDRGMYQVKGAYAVRGGLPTLSKRAR
jgi:hypothetical protein